jgi:hypothetical protein
MSITVISTICFNWSDRNDDAGSSVLASSHLPLSQIDLKVSNLKQKMGRGSLSLCPTLEFP